MANAPFKMKGSTFKYERDAQMRTSTGYTRLKKGIQRIKDFGKNYIKSNNPANLSGKIIDVISGRSKRRREAGM